MMNYLNVNENNRQHLLKIVDLLYNEMCSAGGDGDALWYSRWYNVHDLLPLITEYNKSLKFPLNIEVHEKSIHFGIDQEWIIITNDIETYNTSPDWVQMKIRY